MKGARSTRPLFITLEGPEGAGKSTQGRQLAGWLRRQGRSVLYTREPGGTRLGLRLRRILLEEKGKEISPFVELCLYEASRAILVSEVIRPALASGKIVIIDRFQDSTWVYQGWAGRLEPALVERLGKLATGGLAPDLTLLLDLPVRQGLARVRRPNRFEAKPLKFHEKVRQGYRTLARRQPGRIRVISAERPAAEVQRKIREEVRRVL